MDLSIPIHQNYTMALITENENESKKLLSILIQS